MVFPSRLCYEAMRKDVATSEYRACYYLLLSRFGEEVARHVLSPVLLHGRSQVPRLYVDPGIPERIAAQVKKKPNKLEGLYCNEREGRCQGSRAKKENAIDKITYTLPQTPLPARYAPLHMRYPCLPPTHPPPQEPRQKTCCQEEIEVSNRILHRSGDLPTKS